MRKNRHFKWTPAKTILYIVTVLGLMTLIAFFMYRDKIKTRDFQQQMYILSEQEKMEAKKDLKSESGIIREEESQGDVWTLERKKVSNLSEDGSEINMEQISYAVPSQKNRKAR